MSTKLSNTQLMVCVSEIYYILQVILNKMRDQITMMDNDKSILTLIRWQMHFSFYLAI
jgi:hypothetical protein